MHITVIVVSGRNNSMISANQQDYLAGKSSSPKRYLVVRKWPRFKLNMMKIFVVEILQNLVVVHWTTAVTIFGSPTKFLIVLGLPDYHYFDP